MCDHVELRMCDHVELRKCDHVELRMCDHVELRMCVSQVHETEMFEEVTRKALYSTMHGIQYGAWIIL